jgi:hypothetical protein
LAGARYRTLNGSTTYTVIPNFTMPDLLNRIRSVVTPTRTDVQIIREMPNQTQSNGSFFNGIISLFTIN